jgi:hypothetical protein
MPILIFLLRHCLKSLGFMHSDTLAQSWSSIKIGSGVKLYLPGYHPYDVFFGELFYIPHIHRCL